MQSELKPCYLLMKRGLYYAPDRHGYTGVKARAGRYREVDALGLDGVTAIHEDDAAEFSPACWPDIKEAVLRAEITRLTEALRAAEERADEGYQAAIADVVEWLRVQQHGRTSDNYPGYYARQIEQRFGKDA